MEQLVLKCHQLERSECIQERTVSDDIRNVRTEEVLLRGLAGLSVWFCGIIIPPYGSMGGILRLLYVFLFVFFVCPVKLFSAEAGPISAQIGMRHHPDASQVLRDFGGATPRDGEIIAKNVKIRCAYGAKVSDKMRQ